MSERRGALTWVHFGDLHIQGREDENYLDFIQLIDEANDNLQDGVDFAFLPGDNADDGTDAEYELVHRALDRLKLPVQIIPGIMIEKRVLSMQLAWDPCGVDDGVHSIRIQVEANGGARAQDEIWVSVNGQGKYASPLRSVIDFENTIGAWPEKSILGTQPNENGTRGPWPSWSTR